jgi:transposase
MVKKFSEEYKLEAVLMVLETGISASQVVKDLGIGRSTLEKWVREYKEKTETKIGLNINEREELRNLRAENQKLKLERELLKKATIFFANDRLN